MDALTIAVIAAHNPRAHLKVKLGVRYDGKTHLLVADVCACCWPLMERVQRVAGNSIGGTWAYSRPRWWRIQLRFFALPTRCWECGHAFGVDDVWTP